MEQNTAWSQINAGHTDDTLFDLVLPSIQCGSSGISSGENRINYVVNAGPINDYENDMEYGRPERRMRDDKMYTLFFDHFVRVGNWQDAPATGTPDVLSKTRVSIDTILSMD